MARTAIKDEGKIDRRLAVVTGGSSGIGRDIANRLYCDGFTVVALGRRARRLRQRRGEKFHPYVCDVSRNAEIKRTVREIITDHGDINVLINAAGIARPENAFEITQESIISTLSINLVGTINMSLTCVPSLKKTKGTIINLSSALAQRPRPGMAIYAASKGGIDALTRAFALELAPKGVRVNAVSPSMVRSEIFTAAGMRRDAYQRLLKERGQSYPLGRAGEPKDVSELVSYLASDASRWMTGVVIPIDGGFLAS